MRSSARFAGIRTASGTVITGDIVSRDATISGRVVYFMVSHRSLSETGTNRFPGLSSRKVWKMNAAGTITALDDIPAAITATVGPAGTTEVGNPAALPFVQPSNGHIRVQQTATLARVLNPSAASGSQWSNPGDTLGVLSANVVDSASAYGVAACTIYEYGVVAFLKNHSASQPAEFWLAKL